MPLVADRVRDSGTVTGTGSVTLAGNAPAGFQTFASAFAVGTMVWYSIVDSASGAWEVGYGTLANALTLSRDVVTGSSNAGNKVTFGSSVTVDVFNTAAADIVQPAGLGRQIALRNNLALY